MADQLNMGGLNLGDHQQNQAPRSYIPPHMRNKPGGPVPMGGPGGPPPGPPGPSPAAMNGLNNSAWAG